MTVSSVDPGLLLVDFVIDADAIHQGAEARGTRLLDLINVSCETGADTTQRLSERLVAGGLCKDGGDPDPPWLAFLAAHRLAMADLGEDDRLLLCVPAIAAASAMRSAPDGQRAIAVALASEATLRLDRALSQGQARIGWSRLGSNAGIGAALATARLLQLTRDQAANAVGLAATQSCGIEASLDREGRALLAARTAHLGVEAAQLAAAEVTAPLAAIAGRRGLAQLTAGGADSSSIAQELGEQWIVSEIGRKAT